MRFRTCASRVSGASQLGIRCGKRSSHSICLLVLALFLTFTLAASAQNAQISLPAAGIINTLAGNGTKSNTGDNGPATSAQLYYPDGVAVDANGNIFIADTYNNRIREVNFSTGLISTIAGFGASGPANAGYSPDGTLATSALLNQPQGVAVDSSGNVYIADTANHVVREVMATTNGSMIAGNIYTIAGNHTGNFSGDGGPAINAALDYPVGITLDSSGNLYIADTHNNRVREVTTSTGIINTIAGSGTKGYSGDGGAPKSAALSFPMAVAIDSLGDVYIADYNNNVIREVMAATNGSLLAGNIYTVVGGGTVCSQASDSVGDGCSPTAATLLNPSGVAVDGFGSIFIADSGNFRIRAATATTAGAYQAGNIYTVAGTGIANYSGDGGSATSAAINMPAGGLALDAARNIYIADVKNSRIRAIGATLLTQTITFNNPTPPQNAIYGQTFTVSPSASSGLTSFTYASSGACTNSGATYSMISGTGTCTVTVTQSGDKNYGVGQVSATVNAARAAYSVNWPSPGAIVYGTPLAVGTPLQAGTQLNASSSATGCYYYAAPAASQPQGTISTANCPGNSQIPNPIAIADCTTSATTCTLIPNGTVVLPADQIVNGLNVPATLNVVFVPTDTVDYTYTDASTALVVNQATASVALAMSGAAASPTFTATITSSSMGPNGTDPAVTFYGSFDGEAATPLGTVTPTVNGSTITAQLSPSLQEGQYAVTAGWQSVSNFSNETSNSITDLVNVIAVGIVNPNPSQPVPIPADFMGLSTAWTQAFCMMGDFDWSSVNPGISIPTTVNEPCFSSSTPPSYTKTVPNTIFYNLIKNLTKFYTAPLLFRIEGDEACDNTTNTKCSSAENDLGPAVRSLNTLASNIPAPSSAFPSGVKYTLGVDLWFDDVSTAQREAAQWQNGISDSRLIAAYEIGNEPDNYTLSN